MIIQNLTEDQDLIELEVSKTGAAIHVWEYQEEGRAKLKQLSLTHEQMERIISVYRNQIECIKGAL